MNKVFDLGGRGGAVGANGRRVEGWREIRGWQEEEEWVGYGDGRSGRGGGGGEGGMFIRDGSGGFWGMMEGCGYERF